MGQRGGTRARAWASLVATALALTPRAARANDAADELLREARAHEAAHEEDVALRRYNEALQIDPASGEVYFGLGMLRLRMGDAREAERVFEVALVRAPAYRRSLYGRARARWALGRRAEAERDLEQYALAEGDPAALRELAGWYGEDGKTPAQLGVWRRVFAWATQGGDAAAAQRARVMVRALQYLVGAADPVSAPSDADPVRRAIAQVARHGG